jgi:hypothetical protein
MDIVNNKASQMRDLMHVLKHCFHCIPNTYFTVFGTGGTTLCHGMKIEKWIALGGKPCARYIV